MNDEALENGVGALLLARGWTISAAESCTGGLFLHRLTNIAGSSAYVIGGVVAYDNRIKIDWVGVDTALIQQHGAVSAPVAEALAVGIAAKMGTTIGVGITGIAGPGGGSLEKPVGLVYIGVAMPSLGVVRVERCIHPGDREAVKAASADAALRMVLGLG